MGVDRLDLVRPRRSFAGGELDPGFQRHRRARVPDGRGEDGEREPPVPPHAQADQLEVGVAVAIAGEVDSEAEAATDRVVDEYDGGGDGVEDVVSVVGPEVKEEEAVARRHHRGRPV